MRGDSIRWPYRLRFSICFVDGSNELNLSIRTRYSETNVSMLS